MSQGKTPGLLCQLPSNSFWMDLDGGLVVEGGVLFMGAGMGAGGEGAPISPK